MLCHLVLVLCKQLKFEWLSTFKWWVMLWYDYVKSGWMGGEQSMGIMKEQVEGWFQCNKLSKVFVVKIGARSGFSSVCLFLFLNVFFWWPFFVCSLQVQVLVCRGMNHSIFTGQVKDFQSFGITSFTSFIRGRCEWFDSQRRGWLSVLYRKMFSRINKWLVAVQFPALTRSQLCKGWFWEIVTWLWSVALSTLLVALIEEFLNVGDLASSTAVTIVGSFPLF